MSYKKALRKLEKLPIGERQLAASQYVWEVKKGKSHCGCAIGKLLTERQRVRLFKFFSNEVGRVNESGVESLRREFLKIDKFDGEASGILDLTCNEAQELQSVNDSFRHDYLTERNSYAYRKARYKYVVAWLKEQIADVEGEQTHEQAAAF